MPNPARGRQRRPADSYPPKVLTARLPGCSCTPEDLEKLQDLAYIYGLTHSETQRRLIRDAHAEAVSSLNDREDPEP